MNGVVALQQVAAEKLYRALIADIDAAKRRFGDPASYPATQMILDAAPDVQVAFISVSLTSLAENQYAYPTMRVVARLLRRKLPYSQEDVQTLLQRMVELEQIYGTLSLLTDSTHERYRLRDDSEYLSEICNALKTVRAQLSAWNMLDTQRTLLDEIELMVDHERPWYFIYAHLQDASDGLSRLSSHCYSLPSYALVRSFLHVFKDNDALAACRPLLEELLASARKEAYTFPDQRKLFKLLDDILSGKIGQGKLGVPLNPMRADDWGTPLLPYVEAMDAPVRDSWLALLRHCYTAKGTYPDAKWSAPVAGLCAALGATQFRTLSARWLKALAQNKGGRLDGDNSVLLKGLAWSCAIVAEDNNTISECIDSSLLAALADAAIEGYRKLPGIGPRAVMVASACVYALQCIPELQSAAQLERVRLNVKQPAYLKGIERALAEVAQRTGMSRDDLAELTVPTFDFVDGRIRRSIGSDHVELTLTGINVHVQWYDANGKTRKGPSAETKRNCKAELKALKTLCGDIEHMLHAQRDRLERLFLSERQWSVTDWRARYLDHPLIGQLARKLIWRFSRDEQQIDAILYEDRFIGADGEPLQIPEGAQVSLWHPIMSGASEIQAWRSCLEERRITQPFKQAHREIYLLTDAERTTQVYSNRFAAHILKQHQFHALAAARGWHNQLRLMVDDSYEPATLRLPHWKLRAEYWIEGIGEDYGEDTTEAGSYLRLTTDQVRFYPLESAANYAHASGGGYYTGARPGQAAHMEPLPLADIPPIVFSEVMRDVDLFVGVASIGNDPTWEDGGRENRYRAYWYGYSFGELSATAQSRKQLLAWLIPQLAIADRCTLSDRFLIVRGNLRTYKIHFGSGNILMEPDDQYLCIVPARNVSAGTGDLFLPFEGDSTFSIILSKAFLLADDEHIDDMSIVRQIKRE